MEGQPQVKEATSLEAENGWAASVSDGGMEKLITVEGKKEEFLQETMTMETTVAYRTAGRTDTEEEVEAGDEVEEGDGKDEEEEEEAGDEVEEGDGKDEEEEEEEEETKTKKSLGHWESEASTDVKPPLPDPAFNRRCSLIVSDVRYKEGFEKMKGQSQFVPGAELIHSKNISAVISESKYKEEGKKEASLSLYSILPETPETQHAKEASELQSEIKYKGNVKTEISSSLYSLLPETTETQFVKELTALLSENKYKEEGKKEMSSSLYSQLPETSEMQLARPSMSSRARKSTKKTGRGRPPSPCTPTSQTLQISSMPWRCPSCRVR
ncbi:uncharacterized protein FYW61_016042 [Anableps anableps]